MLRGIRSPELFPIVLAPFRTVSLSLWWLRIPSVAAGIVWLFLTRRLLMRLGASAECSTFLVLATALSPVVVALATGLCPETLFALLATASLLALLGDRPSVAGALAGMATLTLSAGMSLIIAALMAFLARGRFRPATRFAVFSALFASPALGWTLSDGVPIARLHLSEIGLILGSNVIRLAAAPFILLSGYDSLYPGLLTALAVLFVLIRRRHFLPDLFVGLYCLLLIFRVELPIRAFAPVLPLLLWMLWRVVRDSRFALVSRIAAIALAVSAAAFNGIMAFDRADVRNWSQSQELFSAIRANTPPTATLLADLDPAVEVWTGRKTVRGFTTDLFRSRYMPTASSLVTPDSILATIGHDRVGYVVVTPDRQLPESPSFHRAIGALERGGTISPISLPGVGAEFRLYAVNTPKPRPLPGAGISR